MPLRHDAITFAADTPPILIRAMPKALRDMMRH